MAFNDIKAWREIMDAEEDEKLAYDAACAAAERRAVQAEQDEYDEIEQASVDPATCACGCGNGGCVCLDDLEDDEVDFSAYGISEADLGVGPADEHYPTARDLAREPLVRIPAAVGRPASDADLAAQDVVRLMAEALAALREKKAAEQIGEEIELGFGESDDELTEEEDSPEKVDDKIEQMAQNDDYPLSDADWAEINDQPSYQKKIDMIQAKIKDRWSSLSPEAKRQVRADVMDLRQEFIKSRWSEKRYKEALRLQQASRTRALNKDEEKKFADIVRFDLDDAQREMLQKNLYANRFRIPREGRKTRVPASDAQSGNVADHHKGEDAVERSNETGLDSEFDPEKFEYVPEPMAPGTEIPADFNPEYGPDQTLGSRLVDLEFRKKQLEKTQRDFAKGIARDKFARTLPPEEEFETYDTNLWKKLVGSLEPDEIEEIKTELLNELPGNRTDNKDALDCMLGDMKITQKKMASRAGYGADQKGNSGGFTQQGDKLINLLLYALAVHLNICQDPIDLVVGNRPTHYQTQQEAMWKNLRSENTAQRDVRKELRPIFFREICNELDIDLDEVAREAHATPAYIGERGHVKEKRAADNVVITAFIREYDQMSAAERETLRQIFRAYVDGGKIVKLYTGLNDDQNTEFQDLINRMRDEGDLPNEDRVRLLQLDIMRRNPDIGEDTAHARAERKYAEMTRNGDAEFVQYTTRLAKTFVRGHSQNHTRDTITNPDRAN